MNAQPATVALHLGFSDPRSPLRLPLPLPQPLRVAITAQLAARGGTVLETPSGLCSHHPHAALAVQAAIEILASNSTPLLDDSTPLALRAVLLAVPADSAPACAATLVRAAQVLTQSRDHTLLLTRDLYAQLDRPLSERARLAVPPAWVDAHPELADLFDLDWRAAALARAEVTSIAEPQPASKARERLRITHGGVELSLLAKDCPITLGRDKSCALHLGGDVASRIHARIEFAHDQFYLIDASRNGTYLLTPQGEEVFLHHERLPLLGRGVISPGAPIVKQTGEVLRYACRADDDLGVLIASLVSPAAPLPPPQEPLIGALATH